MTKKIFGLVALAVAATPSFANDLWDQQVAMPTGGTAFGVVIDSTLGDFPLDSTYQLQDVEVGAPGWNVSSVSMIVVDNSPTAATGITQAILNVFPNTTASSSPSASNDPTTGTTVSVTMSLLSGYTNAYLMTASGLNTHLNSGEYWIGLTALGNFAGSGEVFDGYATTGTGSSETGVNSAGALHESYLINPGGGFFGLPAAWQPIGPNTGDPFTVAHAYSAIDIQGTPAPEPASVALLGLGIVGIIRRRRSRN